MRPREVEGKALKGNADSELESSLSSAQKFEIRSTKLETIPKDPNSNELNGDALGFSFKH